MWPPSITNIMRKTLLTILALGAVAMMSCSKDNTPSQPIWPDDGDDEPTETLDKPLDGGNIVVAHRGGSTEAGKGFPDNSIASLEYAMSLKCYASECDIYWTKDNKVVVAHADSECKINGVHPWEATLAEHPINACRRSCEIIKEMKAQNFVEFICTGNATVMAESYKYARAAGVNIGWMGNQAASVYQQKSYTWANLSTQYMKQGGGVRTIEEFTKAGIAISVFNADDDATMNYYISNASSMKAICTNYPKKLIEKMQK